MISSLVSPITTMSFAYSFPTYFHFSNIIIINIPLLISHHRLPILSFASSLVEFYIFSSLLVSADLYISKISYLSPIIFNMYICFIVNRLNSVGFNCLIQMWPTLIDLLSILSFIGLWRSMSAYLGLINYQKKKLVIYN